jgi:H+/Cl- antiporter ClcA
MASLGVDPFANRTRQLVVEVKRLGFSAKLDVDKWISTRRISYNLTPEEELYVHHKLKALFDEKRIFWRTAARAIPVWLTAVLGLVDGSLFSGAHQLRPSNHPFVFLLILAIFLLWAAGLAGQFLHTTVILKHRQEHSARRSETAWKIISPILTFFLGMLTQYLTHKLWPKP